MKGWSETREGIAEEEIFRDEKNCGGGRRRLVRRCRVPNGCRRSVFRLDRSLDWVGPVGNDAASSAQSKRVGAGVKHGGTGLGGCETRDCGLETAGRGGSDTSTAVKDGGHRETARLVPSWGELGGMGSERRTGCGWGASVGVDGVVNNAAGV